MLTLTRCSGTLNTALRVTSAPVPAVVGIAICGAAFSVAFVGEHCGNNFACVENAAAADADNQVASGFTGRLHRCGCDGCSRLAGNIERYVIGALFVTEFEKRYSPFDGAACDDKGTFAHLAG